MKLRVKLQPIDAEPVVRDVVGGRWEEPSGEADETIGKGLWALPGLVDGHAHFSQDRADFVAGDPEGARRRLIEAMRHGVLLAIDKGWGDTTTIDVIDAMPASQRPEVEAAGVMLTVEGGYIPGFGREVDVGSMEAAVASASHDGRGWVKIIGDWPRRGLGPVANFSEVDLKAAVQIAAANGARVAIHTMAREVPSVAVRAGVQSIDHGLFLEPDDLETLGARGGIWVPTILRMEGVILQLGENSSGGRLIAEGLANVARLLPFAAETGVHVLAGTDLAVATHQVLLEAVRLGEMGLGASAVVQAISRAGYEATGRSPDFSAGAPADAVLFGANPIEDLGVLAHPAHVLRLGKIVL